MSDLREKIRAYEIVCTCWDHGVRPGFRVVDAMGGVYLGLDGKNPQGHFDGCPWAEAVAAVYEQERKSES